MCEEEVKFIAKIIGGMLALMLIIFGIKYFVGIYRESKAIIGPEQDRTVLVQSVEHWTTGGAVVAGHAVVPTTVHHYKTVLVDTDTLTALTLESQEMYSVFKDYEGMTVGIHCEWKYVDDELAEDLSEVTVRFVEKGISE